MSETPEIESPILSFGGLAVVRRLAGFVLASLRARAWVVAGLLVLFAAVGAGAAILLPREYSSQTRMLVRTNYVMPALAHPKRAIPPGADAPAQAAAELIRDRAVLVEIVRKAGLAGRWKADRPALLRLKDDLRERIRGPLPDAEMEDAIVAVLERRLVVGLQQDVLTIRASWWDPATALEIVNAAREAFLEARRRFDIDTIEDTRAILSTSAETLQSQVNQSLEALRVARARAHGASLAVSRAGRGPAARSALKDRIDALRAMQSALEHQRREKVAALRVRLAEQEALYGDRHPDLQATRAALAGLSEPSGASQTAAEEERRLIAEYLGHGGRPDMLETGSSEAMVTALAVGSPEDDETVAYARADLRMNVDQYQDIVSRLNNSRLELEIARAAFSYRYMVTEPAEAARRPDKPNTVMVVLGSLVAGAVSALVTAVLLELRKRALADPALLDALFNLDARRQVKA